MPRPMTFGSLFAGIGGFDLGFERAGMLPLWQVEIDDYCTRVLEKHWPNVKRYRDVRECGKHNLESVDVVCGGFPCQPHSHAGKRKGAEDDRDLWPEFKRIIDELRPRWVVAENVPGIRTTILDAVLSDLEGMGYAWETAIIPACAVDAPHRRDRVWIVANSNAVRCGRWTHDERQRAPERNGTKGAGSYVADTESRTSGAGLCQSKQGRQRGRRSGNGNIPSGFWVPEPDVGRVAHGVPSRVDRLRSLGNAVVPQVTEFIGRLIVEVDDS
jgi:DNA (cytosine-5)-methyltransferase 1